MVEKGLEEIQDADVKIVLGHHPIDSFEPGERRKIRARFGKHKVIYLHGDQHENDVINHYGSGIVFLDFQAAAAFQERESKEFKNGFLWAELDFEQEDVAVLPRLWSSDNQKWGIDGLSFPGEPEFRHGEVVWVFPLPSPKVQAPLRQYPLGWMRIDRKSFDEYRPKLDTSQLVSFFDGAEPGWKEALSSDIYRREIVSKLQETVIGLGQQENTRLVLLRSAAGEGRSTVLRQTVVDLIEKQPQWHVIWHHSTETPLPEEFVRKLPEYENQFWLIVSDDGYEIAADVERAIRLLRHECRKDVYFLLSTTDFDWVNAKAERLDWGTCKLDCPIPRLTKSEAHGIVKTWKACGKEGMGKLADDSIDVAENKLFLAARNALEERENKSNDRVFSYDGAFLGAMLNVRYGNDIKRHVETRLKRIEKYNAPGKNGKTLLDAYAYIAALHSVGLLILTKDVLGKVLGCEPTEIRKVVLARLANEAIAHAGGGIILTRHYEIAKTSVDSLSKEQDFDNVFIELAIAALETFQETFGFDMKPWNELAEQLCKRSHIDWGLHVADALRRADEEDLRFVNEHAKLLRLYKDAAEGVRLYRTIEVEPGRRHVARRAFFNEWGTCERSADNLHLAAWLVGVALADQGAETELESKDDQRRLSASLGELSLIFRKLVDSKFSDKSEKGVYNVALDSVTQMQHYLEQSPKVRLTEENFQSWIDHLSRGLEMAYNKREKNLQSWVTKVDALTFEKLKRCKGV